MPIMRHFYMDYIGFYCISVFENKVEQVTVAGSDAASRLTGNLASSNLFNLKFTCLYFEILSDSYNEQICCVTDHCKSFLQIFVISLIFSSCGSVARVI